MLQLPHLASNVVFIPAHRNRSTERFKAHLRFQLTYLLPKAVLILTPCDFAGAYGHESSSHDAARFT